MTLTEMMDSLAAAVRSYIDERFFAFEKRIGSVMPKDGAPGRDGKDGVDGKDGAPGRDGKEGKDGRDGRDVDMGEVRSMVDEMFTGYPVPKDGKDGAPGRDGKDGKDADMEATRAFIKSLVDEIPAAKDGKDGAPGRDGKDGKDADMEATRAFIKSLVDEIPPAKDGADGKDGAAGRDGKDGGHGKDGRDGREGKDGKDGRDGENGRDALSLDIMEGIDFDKSYAAGTWASHQGGIWRCLGGNKWKCMVDGLCGVEESKDGRTVKTVYQFASGKAQIFERSTREMVYCGVYDAGKSYAQGDAVTYRGSLWHANADNKDAPGDGSASWQLVAKKGADAKEPYVMGKK